MKSRFNQVFRGGFVLLSVVLAACASPGGQTPRRALIEAPTLGLDRAEGPANWPVTGVRALGIGELDALIEEALVGQPGLQVAQDRLERAEAAVAQLRGGQGPQLGLGADFNRQRFSDNGLLPPPLAGSVRSTAALRLTGTLELDFFGRHAAALRAALGQARAARAEWQAARSVLAARVARAYIGLGRALAVHELCQRALAQRLNILALTQARVRAGVDQHDAVLEADGAVAQARGQCEEVAAQAVVLRHQLAVLLGRAPGALAELTPRLDEVPLAALPDRLPADLLGRRADVAAARWRVEASLAERDHARTLFYPNLNLMGVLGLDAVGVQRLFEPSSRALGVMPALRLPIFDGGQLRAQLRGREADLNGAIASYNGLVLEVLQEAADALNRVDSLARQRQAQAAALVAAQQAVDLARQRRAAGVSSQLKVLAAELPVLAHRARALELKAQHLEAQIGVMQALGSTWPDGLAAVALPASAALDGAREH